MTSTHECSWRPDSRIPIATDLAVMGSFGHQLNVHWLLGGCTCQRPVRAAVNMHVSDLHHLSCRLAACQQSVMQPPLAHTYSFQTHHLSCNQTSEYIKVCTHAQLGCLRGCRACTEQRDAHARCAAEDTAAHVQQARLPILLSVSYGKNSGSDMSGESFFVGGKGSLHRLTFNCQNRCRLVCWAPAICDCSEAAPR